ncbi:MAG: signal peptidase II [Candidatus Peregrinibacteria bacterium]|nr:signal peptidase II [Candidatus Peregrinibacteria bacterium]MDZ4244314.1 signal peptidase II [Candidatus Gracilibacteria bacterium]
MKTIKVINRVFLFGLLFAFADQLSKVLVQNYGKIPISLNEGVAFSIKFPYTLQILVTTILLICLIYFSKNIVETEKTDTRRKTAVIALAMIFGGGLGNLMDRINMGYVVDFINIGFWPVFNVADSFVTIGALLFAVLWFKK